MKTAQAFTGHAFALAAESEIPHRQANALYCQCGLAPREVGAMAMRVAGRGRCPRQGSLTARSAAVPTYVIVAICDESERVGFRFVHPPPRSSSARTASANGRSSQARWSASPC
jgi:hypothetical protein